MTTEKMAVPAQELALPAEKLAVRDRVRRHPPPVRD